MLMRLKPLLWHKTGLADLECRPAFGYLLGSPRIADCSPKTGLEEQVEQANYQTLGVCLPCRRRMGTAEPVASSVVKA